MTLFTICMVVGAALGIAATALCALVRIIQGPTILDRMIASDVLLTTLMLAVGAEMVVRGHTETIPLMIAIAATSVFATITVARYVKRRGASPSGSSPERGGEGTSHV
ncbi:sodium:proton antiporter [Leucobacter sp. CSA1]|uniref:Sodium:proton antiporter n=1 Tax=Leucobacter chromiisoli TaxID=2796471 RepID=A0A934Q6I1_9MICO|nr:monovalent cation/H+ antiporter complex subunit F [Leucobacter chromiisoli]MBK0419235.1 sodium:proton antiporter [Leucobacter chromiisoli]